MAADEPYAGGEFLRVIGRPPDSLAFARSDRSGGDERGVLAPGCPSFFCGGFDVWKEKGVELFAEFGGLDDADLAPDYFAGAVDDGGGGEDLAKAEALHIGGVGAKPDGEVDFVFANELEDLGGIGHGVAGGADDLDAESCVFVLDGSEVGHFGPAGFAPGGPEVEDHNAAAIGGERLFGAGKIPESKRCIVGRRHGFRRCVGEDSQRIDFKDAFVVLGAESSGDLDHFGDEGEEIFAVGFVGTGFEDVEGESFFVFDGERLWDVHFGTFEGAVHVCGGAVGDLLAVVGLSPADGADHLTAESRFCGRLGEAGDCH